MGVKIKFCGITRDADVAIAAGLGVDAMGLVFAAESSRRVDPATAAVLADSMRQVGVCVVALFVDPGRDEVARVIDVVGPDVLQFHGEETAAFCGSFGRPYVKTVRMRPEVSVEDAAAAHPGAVALLLDAYVPGQPGGTGQRFDWDRWPALDRRLVLAGGLTADNVGEAVRTLRPWAVDVSGGVEGPVAGEKDERKMTAFIRTVRNHE